MIGLFQIGGLFLIAVGVVAVKEEISLSALDDLAVDPTVFLLFVGSVMVIVGFVGCLGPLREHIILLKMVSTFNFVKFILSF